MLDLPDPGFSPDVRLGLCTSDPRNGDEFIQWTAQCRFEGDVMLAYNALPFLADLPAEAEKRGQWEAATVETPTEEAVGPSERSYREGIRSNTRLCLSQSGPECAYYDLMLRQIETRFVGLYQKHVNSHAIVRGAEGIEGYDLLRYDTGQFFREHVDAVRGNSTTSLRRLSVVGFCNNDFEGGQLIFPRQKLTVEPEPGLLVVFPAVFTHPHQALEVTAGVKYSVVTWFL